MEEDYSNDFEVIPADVNLRPPRKTRRPTVPGPQSAKVVGPEGEEIYTDEHGRVKVQFTWDAEGTFDDTSSCWIRVQQVQTTGLTGLFALPRIGCEVLVEFINGDPDRPIIMGRVPNPETPVPYSLPDEKFKMTYKSLSSGGGGFNEVRFDDVAGEEQIFIHAQFDLDKVVLPSMMTSSSKTASGSDARPSHHSAARSKASPCGDMGRSRR